MVEKQVGMRVYAVRDSDEIQVNLIGFGTYQGIKPVNGEHIISSAQAEKIQRSLERSDKKPIDVGHVLRSRRSYLMTKDEIEESVRRYEERRTEEQSLPMGERIRRAVEANEGKPCIHLDSGFIVWGFEVLWGPEEKWERFLRGRAIVNVPPPFEARRWKEETHDGAGTETGGKTHEQGGTAHGDRRRSRTRRRG